MAKKKGHHLGDKFFKKAMRNPTVAKEFFESYLPESLQKRFDLASLQLKNETFIDDAYTASSADILYELHYADERAFLYLLCEHQSQSDPLMAYRLLKYTVRIIETHLKSNKVKTLPLVYPMVLYTGQNPWRSPRDIFQLFGSQVDLAREYFMRPYHLIDVHRLEDESLKQQILSGIFQYIFKYQKVRDMMSLVQQTVKWLEKIHDVGEVAYFEDVIYFLIYQSDSQYSSESLLDERLWASNKARGKAMTLADRLREEGLQKGLEQGIEQGIEQGRQEGMAQGQGELVARLLEMGFDISTLAKAAEVPVDELEKRIHLVSEN